MMEDLDEMDKMSDGKIDDGEKGRGGGWVPFKT